MSALPASNPRSGPALPALTVAFAGLFVLSGAAGLIYQVVWTRHLVQVFGVTAFAVSTVLVSFMGGMALGAAWIGRIAERARRPFRLFAILEAGIGIYALALPVLLAGADWVYAALFDVLPDTFVLRSAIRFVLCLGLLLVPTVLMGGTLPALGQGLVRRPDRLGVGVGLLYFVNTLGAAVGCYLAGFELIPKLGLSGATTVAFALNITVAVAGWALDAGTSGAPAAAGGEAVDASPAATAGLPPPASRPRNWPLWVAFGSGMTALAFEIVWFRVLVLSFGSTVYSFSAMLSVFLLGLALGSLLVGAISDRVSHPTRLLVWTQGLVALFVLGGHWSVNNMPRAFLALIRDRGLDFDGMNATKLLLSFATLLPAAMAFGGTFPAVVRLAGAAGGRGPGSLIGRVYGWNTLGAIVGSFLTGFVLLPAIGAEWVLRGIVVVAVGLAFGSILSEPGVLRARWAIPSGSALVIVLAALAFAPPWNRTLLGAGVYFEPTKFLSESGEVQVLPVIADYRLMTFTEGYNDTIISFASPKGKFITVNGSTTASDQFEDMFSQRMLGHLPMALHPGPVRKAAIVGLGAGVTAGAIGLYEVEELLAIELEEGVFVASRFFERENHAVLDNPKVRIRIDDGRNYFKRTSERYDVISSAPNFPSLTGSGALYSREFFELTRSRLAPGGVMCQFAPIWRLRTEELRSIVGSFTDVYPYVRGFSTGISLVLLGRMEPFPEIDIDEIARRVDRPEVAASLAEIGVRGPVELLSFYQFDEREAVPWVADAPRNTDDDPRIEFYAPRALFEATVAPNLAEIASMRASRKDRIARLGLEGEFADSWATLNAAYEVTMDAQVRMSRGEVGEALSLALPAADSGQRYARYVVADHAERTGRALQSEGRLVPAREAYLVAVRYEPDRIDSWIGLGFVDLYLGRLEESERALTEAVRRYPKSGTALSRLGLVREVQERPEEAEVLYRRAIEAQPLLAKPHALLGSALLRDDRLEEAESHLREAWRLGDRSEGVPLGMAGIALDASDPTEALEWAERAVESAPESEAAWTMFEKVAAEIGREDLRSRAQDRLQAIRGGS